MQRCCLFVCLFVCVIQMLGKECGNACRRVGGWTEVKQMIWVSDRPKSTFTINVILDLNILDMYILYNYFDDDIFGYDYFGYKHGRLGGWTEVKQMLKVTEESSDQKYKQFVCFF